MGDFIYKKKWFSAASPVNPKKATATLTFTGTVSDAETVTVGTQIFELKASGNAGTGKIKVDISSGVTADIAVAKIAEAINANSTIVTATASTTDDTVVITYKTVGTAGNEVAVATTCVNGSFGEDVTALSGGQYGTPCPEVGSMVKDTTYHYICTIAGNKDDVEWKRFTPAAY
jgi:phage tail sheath gpL-like